MGVVVLAGEFEDIGDHLLGVGLSWGQKGLVVALLIIVVTQVIRRFSLKAGIGALLGMVLCLGIYDAREKLSDAFSDEINGHAVVQVEDPAAASPAGPIPRRDERGGSW